MPELSRRSAEPLLANPVHIQPHRYTIQLRLPRLASRHWPPDQVQLRQLAWNINNTVVIDINNSSHYPVDMTKTPGPPRRLPRTTRKVIPLADDEWDRIGELMHKRRIKYESDAVRLIVKTGLDILLSELERE